MIVGKEHWDNKTLDYDLEKYNWPAWALSVIQEKFPQIKELETIHTVLQPSEIVRVSQYIHQACNRLDFMQKFDEFAQEIAAIYCCISLLLVQIFSCPALVFVFQLGFISIHLFIPALKCFTDLLYLVVLHLHFTHELHFDWLDFEQG